MRLLIGASAIPFCLQEMRILQRAAGSTGTLAYRFRDRTSQFLIQAERYVYKHRNVRFCYPSPLVELALHLCQRHRVKDIAVPLGLPLATLYRWRLEKLSERKSLSRSNDNGLQYEDICLELVSRCEQYGFRVRERLSKCRMLDSRELGDRVESDSGRNFALPPQVEPNEPVEPVSSPVSDVAQENGKRTHYRFRAARARHSRRVLERLLQARELIETRFNLHLTCERLAHVAGMSLHHFVRVYKQAFGESAQQHLARVRVFHAQTLLQSTSQPAALIAVAVGFDSYATLSKAFRSVTGSNVSEFCRTAPQLSSSNAQLADSRDDLYQSDDAAAPEQDARSFAASVVHAAGSTKLR